MPERAQPLRVEVSWDGAAAAVTLTGELGITSAPGITERLMKIAKGPPGHTLLTYQGSSGSSR